MALVDVLQDRIEMLKAHVAVLRGQLEQVTRSTAPLEQRLRELEAHLDQNSHNSIQNYVRVKLPGR